MKPKVVTFKKTGEARPQREAPASLVRKIPNLTAEIVIVGLTPGYAQLQIANRIIREHPTLSGQERATALRRQVAFAGSMRTNLVSMLDALGLPAHLSLTSSRELFEGASDRLHATSALRYPVFTRSGGNYGGNAGIVREPLFREMLETLLAPTLAAMPRALIVPLGLAASAGVVYAVEWAGQDRSRVLVGFPHPSGANGHRKRQFAAGAEAMRAQLARWFHERREFRK
jgi:hypothetical protein